MSLRPPSVPVLLSLLAAAWIGLAEITRLSEQLVDARARATSLTDLVGFSRLADVFTWSFVDHEPYRRLREAVGLAVDVDLRAWLVTYAALDVVAVLCLVLLVDRLLCYRPPGAAAAQGLRWLPVLLLGLRAATDLALVLLAWWPAVDALAVLVRMLAGLSWLVAVAVAAVVVHRVIWGVTGAERKWRQQEWLLLRAVYAQRFSLTVVIVIAAIVSLPGGEMLEQFPDAVRAWLDDWRTGGLHALLANAALLLLAVVVLVLGRMRATRVFNGVDRSKPQGRKLETDDDESWWQTYGWWLIPPGFAVLLAAAVWLLDGGEVDLARLAWFVVPLLLLLVLSLVLRVVKGGGGPIKVAADRPRTKSYAQLVWRVGDVLTGAVLVVGGLGLVRAMTAPTLLGAGPGHAAVLVVGFAAVILAWPLTGWALSRVDAWRQSTRPSLKRLAALLRPDEENTLGARPSIVLALLAVAGLAVLALYPMWAAAVLGVVGLVVVALTCLVTLAALAVLQSQDRNTLDLFALLRMRRNPVLALILAVPLAASLQSGDPDVHRIRQLSAPASASAPPPRPTLAQAFTTWTSTSPGCLARDKLARHPCDPSCS